MFIDVSLLFILMIVKAVVFIALLVLKHIIVADGLVVGIIAAAMFSQMTPLSNEVSIVLGILVCLTTIVISKWRVTFALVAVLGSLMWAYVGMELFSQHMNDHIVVSALLVLINIVLHVISRNKITEYIDAV